MCSFNRCPQTQNDSIPTDIDQDLPYDQDADFEFYDNADDIADVNMLDPMDMPVAPGTHSHPVARNHDTSLGADTAFHTANANNNTSNTANTDDNDDDNYDHDGHMTDIATNLNSATGTIPSPTNAANRLFYSTNSEWNSSPWSTISYNKARHQSRNNSPRNNTGTLADTTSPSVTTNRHPNSSRCRTTAANPSHRHSNSSTDPKHDAIDTADIVLAEDHSRDATSTIVSPDPNDDTNPSTKHTRGSTALMDTDAENTDHTNADKTTDNRMPGNPINPETNPHSNTNTKTTFGQWLTKDDKRIPLKISWLCKLPLTSSLHNPDPMMSEEDEKPQDDHQCVSKIALFIAEAKTAHEYHIHIKTSKRNKNSA